MSVRIDRATAERLFREAGETPPPAPDRRVGAPSVPGGVKALGVLPVGPRGSWIVEVPGFYPLSLNRSRRKHWSVEYGLKSETAKKLWAPLLAAGVTNAGARRRRSVKVLAYRPDGKHADEENVRKILNDALKWLGAIADDGPDYLANAGYEARTGPARTVLLIADEGEVKRP